jgi:hypothetical protein
MTRAIEEVETNSWRHEQVHGGDIWGMIAQETVQSRAELLSGRDPSV